MVNKFTRTLLRQGIAMVTDQKSLGARKVSISGGSRREGEVGALGMLPWCRSLMGVPSRTRASHRTLGTRGHGLCPSVPPTLLRRDPVDLSTERSEAEHTGVPSLGFQPAWAAREQPAERVGCPLLFDYRGKTAF